MRRGLLLALAGLLLVPGGGGAVAQDGDPLGQDLSAILADTRLKNAQAGLVVRDATSGEVVFSSSSGRRMQPASNLKMLTTALALETLGPDFRWRTDVLTDGSRAGDTLQGNVYLRGTGDPTMAAKHYQDLAVMLAAGGIRVVTGSLVVDDTAFDQVPYALGWAWDDEPYAYNAETSALTLSPDAAFSAGTILVKVRPSVAGQPVRVELDPPNTHVQVVNTAVTGPGSVSVLRDHGTNVIRVSGATSGGRDVLATVHDPSGLVANVFRKALAANGVAVQGGTVAGATPASAVQAAHRDSMPLRELIVPLLKASNNMLTEVLVKTAGKSWHGGLAALRPKLAALGINPAELYVEDGSGLSRMDQISPDQLASLLVAARSKPWFSTWYEAFPIAGRDGTLVNRMKSTPAEGNVHAKTGSMTGVTALSGYVTSADGRQFVFSLVQNNFIGNAPKDLEDRVAIRLASDVKGQQVMTTMVAPPPASQRTDVECTWIQAC
ncbi:peptidase M15 [Lentzea sp. NBRC 105346]|uniref:D-alanyl-D-alanine carboxypeptidase/D-alanyl-D-alanine endopeptidase n=1 Tax=Lentzea sp. NBRC 105346 TaxID=3032205 RepID=UPI0024A5053F|nr:D-alanyl-D-alanine carboxypeptidase/D-alanyl-D-alanine-endopeptidase [Lentzea sp. NBRC 105346]GLZ29634.1 peptidase M15 [Lentzea sp. NBRC 105346]